jgi:plastocyanin
MKAILPVVVVVGAFAATPLSLQAREPIGPSWSSARPVQVVLSSYKFTPQTLTLHHGQAYRLRFVNNSSRGHNFSAPAFFASTRIDPGDAMSVKNGKVEVAKGQVRDIRVIPLAAGAYHVTCTRFLHAAHGMKGGITVD